MAKTRHPWLTCVTQVKEAKPDSFAFFSWNGGHWGEKGDRWILERNWSGSLTWQRTSWSSPNCWDFWRKIWNTQYLCIYSLYYCPKQNIVVIYKDRNKFKHGERSWRWSAKEKCKSEEILSCFKKAITWEAPEIFIFITRQRNLFWYSISLKGGKISYMTTVPT